MKCEKCNGKLKKTELFNWNENYNCFLNGIDKKYTCLNCKNSFLQKDNKDILFKSEWLSIKQNNGYDYLHEEKANGKLIAIIPYRKINNEYEFLMRYEICPAHSNEHEFCMIIGSCDDLNLSIENTAIKELKEEAGYKISNLINLGWVWDSKVADTKVYLFSCDLTNVKIGIIDTDGTELEKSAYCKWVKEKECYNTNDPKAFALLYKLKEKLK